MRLFFINNDFGERLFSEDKRYEKSAWIKVIKIDKEKRN